MHHGSYIALAAAVAAVAEAAPKPASLPAGVVHFPFRAHRTDTHPLGRYSKHKEDLERLRRRSDTQQITLTNEFTYYTSELDIGTPAQTLDILIDTGSSDLWVMASSNPYCANTTEELMSGEYIDCSGSIIFDYDSSSSFSWNDTDFSIEYGDGTYASGKWAQDTLSIGSLTLDSANFAVGTESNASTCVFGIGLVDGESTVTWSSSSNGGSREAQDTYINIPQQMYLDGDIDSVAYSLWLNDIDSDSGSILFGGVDHAKYTGTLQTVPIVNAYESYSIEEPLQLTVMLNGIDITDSDNTTVSVYSDAAVAALLDSGTTLTYLPSSVVTAIVSAIGGEWDSSVGYYVCECAVANGNSSLEYNFSGATITVPFSEMLFSLVSTTGEAATFESGAEACALGIMESSGTVILGDTFLRSAYVVYDLTNLEISLANTVYNASSSSIEAISSGGVPSATKAASYSSTSFKDSSSVSTPTTLAFSKAVTSAISDDSALATSDAIVTGGAITATATAASNKSGAAGLAQPSLALFAAPALLLLLLGAL